MVPRIEVILGQLLAGEIDKCQAANLLRQHADGTANRLRDEFSAKAMQAFCSSIALQATPESIAIYAYRQADAMLRAREAA